MPESKSRKNIMDSRPSRHWPEHPGDLGKEPYPVAGVTRLLNDIDDPLVYANLRDPSSSSRLLHDPSVYAAQHRQRPWYPTAPASRINPWSWVLVAFGVLVLAGLFVAAVSR